MPALPALHVFYGKPGAGKSTLAARIAREHGATLISEDVWMQRLYGDQMHTFDDYIRCAPKLRSVVGPLATDLLRAGLPVVLDFQANTRSVRTWFRSVAEAAGAVAVLHVLDLPDALCMARIAQRNVERPEGSHEVTPGTYARVSAYLQPPDPSEGLRIETHADPERRRPNAQEELR